MFFGHMGLMVQEDLAQMRASLAPLEQHANEQRASNPDRDDIFEEWLATTVVSGALAQYMKDYATAEQLLTSVLQAADGRELHDPYHVPCAHYELGIVCLRQSKLAEARAHAEACLSLTDWSFENVVHFRAQGILDELDSL